MSIAEISALMLFLVLCSVIVWIWLSNKSKRAAYADLTRERSPETITGTGTITGSASLTSFAHDLAMRSIINRTITNNRDRQIINNPLQQSDSDLAQVIMRMQAYNPSFEIANAVDSIADITNEPKVDEESTGKPRSKFNLDEDQ